MRPRASKWMIPELEITLAPMPASRRIAARCVMWDNSGAQLILGSRGQVYISWNRPRHPSYYGAWVVKPGCRSHAAAHVLYEFGAITRKQLTDYGQLCTKAEERRKARDTVQSFRAAVAYLGLHLTAAQVRILAKLEAE